MLGAIIQILIVGFVIGALARWAVPGPDPMSVPMTIVLGVLGSFVGGGIAAAIFGVEQDSGSVFAVLLGSIVASMLFLIAYRRFIQHRPLTGPAAQELPRRRPGLGTMLGAPGGQGDVAEQLRKLEDLRRDGVLTDEEFEAKKAELLARS